MIWGFGLRSASGESGAQSGVKRLAKRSRSATPAAELQTEAKATALLVRLVTSALVA